MKLKERILCLTVFPFMVLPLYILLQDSQVADCNLHNGQNTGLTRQLLRLASSGSGSGSANDSGGYMLSKPQPQNWNWSALVTTNNTDLSSNSRLLRCNASDCSFVDTSLYRDKPEEDDSLVQEIVVAVKKITNETMHIDTKQRRLLDDLLVNLPLLTQLPDVVNFSDVIHVYNMAKEQEKLVAARTPKFELEARVLRTLQSLVRTMGRHRTPNRRQTGARMNIFSPNDTSAANTNSPNGGLPLWKRFQNEIGQYELYPENSDVVDRYVESLATQPIIGLETIPNLGTQLKLVFRLEDGGRVMFKPKRFPIEQENPPDRAYYDEFERFQAEVAAFHLDRILGFRRVPPVAGRMVNLTHDIKRLASKELRKTFYRSVAHNVCFHGQCDQFCYTPFGVCGTPDLVEGSFASYLPSRLVADRTSWVSPWKQSYIIGWDAAWMSDNTHCDQVRAEHPYNETQRLLDVMDMAAFDFLTGNLDRHNFNTFERWDNDTSLFFYDNGRGFGKSNIDERILLAPIQQCCIFRFSTLERLLDLETGRRKLSQRMRESLAKDRIRPLLTEPHLQALDRRVKMILDTVHQCVFGKPWGKVLIDDGF